MKSSIRFSIYCMLLALIIACSKSDDIEKEGNQPPKTEKPDDITEYNPGNTSSIEKDTKISPSDAKDNQHQDGEGIDKTLDGDTKTLFHTPWNTKADFPVKLEYFFSDTEIIDYFVLFPRTDQLNGRFGEITVYTKSAGEGEYQKFGDFDLEEKASPQMISFPDGLKDPEAIKIEIHSGGNDFASLAEIEFYKKSASVDEYLNYFEDKAATKLKSGLDREDIEEIDNEFIKQMALALYEEVYDDFRIGEFKSYPDPSVIANENKTNTYGFYDNATGIYVKWGTDMVVFIDDFDGNISLKVVNHTQGFEGEDFLLKPGINRFTVNTEGLAYLIYQDNKNEQKVKANFATGKINGYYDVAKHSKGDWDKLIDQAEYDYFDVLGKKAMLSFTISDLKSNTNDIEELIGLYDEMTEMEQGFLGLYKYDRIPETRAYFRTNTHDADMYMYSTSYRTEYNVGTMSDIANPSTFRNSPWGPAHEIGHTHQTRPGLMWLGLTEVTTNIYAQYVQTQWGNPARLDDEDMGEFNNRYEKGFTENLSNNSHAEIEDVFVKLIPFWQLYLYLHEVEGQTDFYKDLHEYIRTHDNPKSDGEAQLNFVKITSEIAKMDLSDFFKAWGFLTPGSWKIVDYGQGTLSISKKQVDEVIDYVSQYPKPADKIEYITEQSIAAYKSGSTPSIGSISLSGNDAQVSGISNAVVIEQERNEKVIFRATRSNFTVQSIDKSDKFYAVGYNGAREKLEVK